MTDDKSDFREKLDALMKTIDKPGASMNVAKLALELINNKDRA